MPRSVPSTLPRPQLPVEPTGADRAHKAAPRSPQRPDSPARRNLFGAAAVVVPPAPAPAQPPAQQG